MVRCLDTAQRKYRINILKLQRETQIDIIIVWLQTDKLSKIKEHSPLIHTGGRMAPQSQPRKLKILARRFLGWHDATSLAELFLNCNQLILGSKQFVADIAQTATQSQIARDLYI